MTEAKIIQALKKLSRGNVVQGCMCDACGGAPEWEPDPTDGTYVPWDEIEALIEQIEGI